MSLKINLQNTQSHQIFKLNNLMHLSKINSLKFPQHSHLSPNNRIGEINLNMKNKSLISMKKEKMEVGRKIISKE